jgi:hypothetical protein
MIALRLPLEIFGNRCSFLPQSARALIEEAACEVREPTEVLWPARPHFVNNEA